MACRRRAGVSASLPLLQHNIECLATYGQAAAKRSAALASVRRMPTWRRKGGRGDCKLCMACKTVAANAAGDKRRRASAWRIKRLARGENGVFLYVRLFCRGGASARRGERRDAMACRGGEAVRGATVLKTGRPA